MCQAEIFTPLRIHRPAQPPTPSDQLPVSAPFGTLAASLSPLSSPLSTPSAPASASASASASAAVPILTSAVRMQLATLSALAYHAISHSLTQQQSQAHSQSHSQASISPRSRASAAPLPEQYTTTTPAPTSDAVKTEHKHPYKKKHKEIHLVKDRDRDRDKDRDKDKPKHKDKHKDKDADRDSDFEADTDANADQQQQQPAEQRPKRRTLAKAEGKLSKWAAELDKEADDDSEEETARKPSVDPTSVFASLSPGLLMDARSALVWLRDATINSAGKLYVPRHYRWPESVHGTVSLVDSIFDCSVLFLCSVSLLFVDWQVSRATPRSSVVWASSSGLWIHDLATGTTGTLAVSFVCFGFMRASPLAGTRAMSTSRLCSAVCVWPLQRHNARSVLRQSRVQVRAFVVQPHTTVTARVSRSIFEWC